jgi:hypothetical protein
MNKSEHAVILYWHMVPEWLADMTELVKVANAHDLWQ